LLALPLAVRLRGGPLRHKWCVIPNEAKRSEGPPMRRRDCTLQMDGRAAGRKRHCDGAPAPSVHPPARRLRRSARPCRSSGRRAERCPSTASATSEHHQPGRLPDLKSAIPTGLRAPSLRFAPFGMTRFLIPADRPVEGRVGCWRAVRRSPRSFPDQSSYAAFAFRDRSPRRRVRTTKPARA
jgi:hypothetical protein